MKVLDKAFFIPERRSQLSSSPIEKYIAPLLRLARGQLSIPLWCLCQKFYLSLFHFNKTLLYKSSWMIKPGPWPQNSIFFGDHKFDIVLCKLRSWGLIRDLQNKMGASSSRTTSIDQSYGLCGRGRGWGDLGEWHWNMYNIVYETSHQSRFNAWYWMLGAGALGRPRGRVWGRRREEGSGWGARVYLWRIHFDVWQN